MSKIDRLNQLRLLLLYTESGVSVAELVESIGLSDRQMRDDLTTLGAVKVGVSDGKPLYKLYPSIDDLELADAIYRAAEHRQWLGEVLFKRCNSCGEEFEANTPLQRYCSRTCKDAANNDAHYNRHSDKIIRRISTNRNKQ